MTKKQFDENKEPLALIVSLEPKSGKVIYDTYDWAERDYWVEVFNKDFPHMLHFSTLNKAAMDARKRYLNQ